MTNITRSEEIQYIHKEYPFIYSLVVASAFFIVLVFLGSLIFEDQNGFMANIYTEVAFGVIFGVLINDRLNRSQKNQDLKNSLVREAGSQARSVSVSAIERMREKGWLRGSNALLNGQKLSNANLSEVNYLSEIDMRGTNLAFANLSKSNLWCNDLEGADLWRTNLKEAKLHWVDFKEAILVGANLEGANLRDANLEGVIFDGFIWKRTLYEGYFQSHPDIDREIYNEDEKKLRWEASFDLETTLPDGTKWTPETDMKRFTNSNHPDFWRPPETDDEGEPYWWMVKK